MRRWALGFVGTAAALSHEHSGGSKSSSSGKFTKTDNDHDDSIATKKRDRHAADREERIVKKEERGDPIPVVDDPNAPKLVKVVVLSRHGTRTPNPELYDFCPNVNRTMDMFHEPILRGHNADLAQLGYAEMNELGRFLRKEYGGSDVLADGPYEDDGKAKFLAQRQNRNILSLESIIQGLYPAGTGQKDLWRHEPNLVPILTTLPYHDSILDPARDGPCLSHFTAEKHKFRKQYQPWLQMQFGDLLSDISDYCGGPIELKDLKDIGDFFELTKSYGIDPDKYKLLNHTTIAETIGLARALTKKQYVGSPKKVSYYVGDFVRLLLAIFKPPGSDDSTNYAFEVLGIDHRHGFKPSEAMEQAKFFVFSNHREGLMAVMTMLGMQYVQNGYEKTRWVPNGLDDDFLDMIPDIPIGTTLIWEQYQEVQIKFKVYEFDIFSIKSTKFHSISHFQSNVVV